MSFSKALRGYWYPLAVSPEIESKPVAKKLLGERVVLWRSPEGIVAMRDQCVHRGTQLSLGQVVDGQLVCPYHGGCFNAKGVATHIPAIPKDREIPSAARVQRVNCVERYGLIYVCLDEPRRPIYEVPEFEQSDYKRH